MEEPEIDESLVADPRMTSIVRVLKKLDRADRRSAKYAVVGTGFLVYQKYLCTCAHVVAQALGIASVPLQRPPGPIFVEFPQFVGEEPLPAKVFGWRPESKGDIAVLELEENPPDGAQPVPLMEQREVKGHHFRAFGFPKGFDDGVPISGIMEGENVRGQIVFHAESELGFYVDEGFSGSPLWDEQEDVVIGMITNRAKPLDTRAGFATPLRMFKPVWPEGIRPTPPKSKRFNGPNLAPQLDHAFIGREALFTELKKQLLGGRKTLALHGLLGVGKTYLAAALAHDEEVKDHFPEGILWTRLGKQSHVRDELERWGVAVGMEPEQIARIDKDELLAKAIYDQIGQRRMLLVIDGAWMPEPVELFKVGGTNCAYLLTTRNGKLAVGFAHRGGTRQLEELSVAEALKLLKLFAPEVVRARKKSLQALLEEVDRLPLLLTPMGKKLEPADYLGTRREVSDLLKNFRDTRRRLELSQPQEVLNKHPDLPPNTALSAEAILTVIYESLEQREREVLLALSVFPEDPNTFSEEAALRVAGLDSRTILDTLYQSGLLEIVKPEDEEGGRYMLHQIILDYLQTQHAPAEARERLARFFVDYLADKKATHEFLQKERGNVLAAAEAARYLGQPGGAEGTPDETTPLMLGLHQLGQIVAGYEEYQLADQLFQKALRLARSLERTAATPQLKGHICDLLYDRGLALARQRRQEYDEQARKLFEEALALAHQIRDPKRVSLALIRLGTVEEALGDGRQAEPHFLEALGLLEQPGDDALKRLILQNLGVLEYDRNQLDQAERYWLEALQIPPPPRDQRRTTELIVNLCSLKKTRGRFAEAKTDLVKLKERFEEIDQREPKAYWFLNMGEVEANLGSQAVARDLLKQGLALAYELKSDELLCHFRRELGKVAISTGAYATAEKRYIGPGLRLAQKTGRSELMSPMRVVSGELSLALGRYDQAARDFEQAKEEEEGDREITAQALYGLARVARARHQLGEAQAYGKESLDGFRSIGHYMAQGVEQWLESLPEEG